MTALEIIKKKELKRRALLGAQYSNAKAYRGVPYEHITNGKPVHCSMTYRGVNYWK